jgi:hypothetical protein
MAAAVPGRDLLRDMKAFAAKSTQRHLNRHTPFFSVWCTRKPPNVAQRRYPNFEKSKACLTNH